MKEKIKIAEIIAKIVSVSYQACPCYLILSILAGVSHGLLNALIMIQLQRLFDELEMIRNNIYQVEMTGVYSKLGGLLLCIVTYHVMTAVHNGMLEDITYRIMRKMDKELQDKVKGVSPIFFQNVDYLKELQKAQNGIEPGVFFFHILSTIVSYYVPYFLFMAFYLYQQEPILVLTIALIAVPVIVTQVIRTQIYDKLANHTAEYDRRYHHYEECLIGQGYMKETRLLGAFSWFFERYLKNIMEHNQIYKEMKKRGISLDVGMKFVSFLGYLGVILLFLGQVNQKRITLGLFAALLTSINTMFQMMEELLCHHFGSLSENYADVKAYVLFLDFAEENTGECLNNIVTKERNSSNERNFITVENASFFYPLSNIPILKRVNLQIDKGEFIAIVGDNGAGKSTLSKMLCGVYAPSSGSVYINGIDTRIATNDDISDNISVVLQNYQRYAMTLYENVYMGNTKEIVDLERVANSLEKVNFNRKTMREGTEVLLSREFGGTNLSGGEWQRVAIARAVYKKADILLLDEPTAAIDPLEEYRLYRLFKELSEGRTTIMVTHRLSAARLADRILVIKGGEIKEIGTHKELLLQKGIYSEMFILQQELYGK